MKKVLVVLLSLILLGGLLFVVIAYFQSKNNLSNDGFNYRVDFEKGAKITNNPQNKKNYLVSSDGKLVVLIAKSFAKADCGSGNATVAASITIAGNVHSLCRLNVTGTESSLYTATFQAKGNWHFVTIFSADNKTPVNQERAKAIASSVEVTN